ncbi:MAG: hypothetical protein ASARMPREDX12_006480 [Alectoria sarmentosa]|nr:MAG: hypothetical protein ASARMPREDX12_006480 [Alectoria sarmentosa]
MDDNAPFVLPAASNAESPTFPFMKLPSELRDLIYDIVLVSGDGSTLRDKNELTILYTGPRMVLELVDNAIMRVSKAVLKEARPISYAKHCFRHALELGNLVSDQGQPTPNLNFLNQKFLQQAP